LAEPELRAELAAARAWSVPRSIFLGRVVRDGDPLWTSNDREWAIALSLVEEATHSCGHQINDSFNPDLAGQWETTAQRCHACASAAKLSAEYQELAGQDPPGADLDGLFFTTAKRGDHDV
jgi:hypothetical protein